MEPERPGLLTFGIVLNVLHALLCLGVATLIGVLGAGALGAGMLAAGADELLPLAVLGTLGGVIFALVLAFYSLVLAVCYGAWKGQRFALWALIVLSILGMVNSGPISVVIGVLTILGAWIALDRRAALGPSELQAD